MSPAFQSLVHILRDGLNANSYKFALARSLVRWARTTKSAAPAEISRDWFAEQFVDLYWPLTVRFRLRQATDPSRDPVVMGLIRTLSEKLSLAAETKLRNVIRQFPDEYRRLVNQVSGRAFNDVLPRFQTVRRKPVSPTLFNRSDGGVIFTAEGLEALKTFPEAIDFMAVGAWVRFTEQYSSAPRLFEKIEGLLERRSLSRYRNFLVHQQESHCFYCGRLCNGSGEVDHVVPWSFVAEDRLWNLVLSCGRCNSEKSDNLPESDFIERLVSRNTQLFSKAGQTPVPGEFAEWASEAALGQHLRSLVERCREERFGGWASC